MNLVSVVGSKDLNYGRETSKILSSKFVNVGYFVKKIFDLPIIGKKEIYGNGKKTFLEVFGKEPCGYDFEFNFSTSILRRKYFDNLNCDFKGLKIDDLYKLYRKAEFDVDINNCEIVSGLLSDLHENLQDLDHMFRYYLNLDRFTETLKKGGRFIDCSCECCSDSYWHDISLRDIDIYANKVSGFKRLSLYRALSGNEDDKKKAIKVVQEKLLNPLEKIIETKIKKIEPINDKLENYKK